MSSTEIESAAMQVVKVCLLIVLAAHIKVAGFHCDGIRRFLSGFSSRDLLRHQAVFMPVIFSQLACILEIAKNFLAQCSQLSSERDLGAIDLRYVDFAWLLNHVLRSEVLVRRLVLRIERAIHAHVSMLDSHESLVAVLGIPLIKLINGALINGDFIYLLAMLNCGRCDLDVDFGAHRTEVVIKELLAAQGMIRVEHVERLHVALIPTSNNL